MGNPTREAETWLCPGSLGQTAAKIPLGPKVLSVQIRESRDLSVPGIIGGPLRKSGSL